MTGLARTLALPRPRVLRRASPRSVRIAIVLAALLAALLAARIHLPDGRWLWNLDLPKLDYPLAVFFHQALAAGRLPLWDDRLGLGFPLYAEGQIGAFYPPNWLIFRFEPLAALDLARGLHLAVAGLGAGLLALRVSGSRPGAFVAAVVATLGGAIVTKLEWTNVVEAYAWLPWVLLPLARTPAPTRRGLVAAGTLWGLQALAGHPNTWLWTGLAAIVFLLARRRPRPADVGRAAAFGALGLAVGAVQLLPTFVLTALSVRQAGLSRDDIFTNAATIFDPLLFAFASPFVRSDASGWDNATAWYPDSPFSLLEAGAYVGLPVLALAFVALRARRARPFVWVALVMLAVPVVAAFRPGWWADAPLLNGLRSPTRTYLVVDLALAVLAAIGVARLGRDPRAPSRALAVVLWGTALYLLTLTVAVVLPQTFQGLLLDSSWRPNLPLDKVGDARESAIRALTQLVPAGIEVAIAILFVMATLAAGARRRVLSRAAALAVLPLLLFSPSTNALRSSGEFSYADTPLVRTIAVEAPHRFLSIDPPGWYPAMPDQLAAAGVADLRMFSSLDLAASTALLDELRRSPDVRRALGVEVVATFGKACPGELLVYFATDRAYLCTASDALHPPYWLPDDLARVGARDALPWSAADATLDVSRIAGVARDVEVRDWSSTSTRVAVDAPAAGWVFVDRAWWPAWRVTVDGVPVTPARALAGQLVPVGSGAHVVEATLFPGEAALGLAAGVLALVVAVLWARRAPGARPS